MKQSLQALIKAVTYYDWYVADPIHEAIALARCMIMQGIEDKYPVALETLLECIPPETNDKQWMNEELKDAIQNAEMILDNQYAIH